MSPEERAAVTLRRVAQGVYQRRIARGELNDALDFISDVDASGNREFRPLVMDDTLREMLKECQQLADTARVPQTPNHVDIGNEFSRVVDNALE